jgi:diacylglycerol kinase family enzyme
MTSVAVIAHGKKSLAGGLSELRRLLADRGIDDPIWCEVRKSREAPDAAKRAVKEGADLLLLWGGDGTVQRSLDALAGSDVTVGVIPAGTANLLAGNLGIPTDLPAAVEIALEGRRRVLDLGVINDERFAVMAGAGFDAIMMKGARGGLKDRFGRLAYVWTGTRATRTDPVEMRIQVDGADWFKAKASCLLLGNIGTLTGGLTAFRDARPDDGLLEVGVVIAHGPAQWAKVLTHLLRGEPQRSKLVRTTRGRRVDAKFDRPIPYQLDGGARRDTRRLQAGVEPGAVTVAAPSKRMKSAKSTGPGRPR